MQNNIQLNHSEHQASKKTFPLCVIANDMTGPLNVGSLFRLCDALGINKLYLCGDTPVPPNAKINRTSRSTEKYIDYEYHADAEIIVTKLKQAGSLIISLEITTSSVSINSEELSLALKSGQAVCLILGSESRGVSETLLSLSDLTVHIPMYGNNSSMNVISAASIACYEIIGNL